MCAIIKSMMGAVLSKNSLLVLAVALASGQICLAHRTPRNPRPIQPAEREIVSDVAANGDCVTNLALRAPRVDVGVRPRETGVWLGDPPPVRALSRSMTTDGAKRDRGALHASRCRRVTADPLQVKRGQLSARPHEQFRSGRRQGIVNLPSGKTIGKGSLKNAATTLFRQPKTFRRYHARGQTQRTTHRARQAAVLKTWATRGQWWQYFFDDFEAAFPDYWQLYGTPTWGVTSYRASAGSCSAWCAGWDYSAGGSYFNDMNAWMIDGPFDLSSATAAEVYFDYRVNSEAYYDSLFVGVSTDGENFYGDAYSGDSGGWILDERLDVSEYAGAANFYVGVQFLSDNINSGYEGGYIDNIELDVYEETTAAADLAVSNTVIVDADNEMFAFDITNIAPQTQPADSYTISVYVDDVFDSSARNQYELQSGAAATWDWQLAYVYIPGTYSVRIEVEPDGGDINPGDNKLTFSLTIGNADYIDLEAHNPVVVDAAQGYFDFDIYNYGPATALKDSYTVAVHVDGQFDSEARNTVALLPTESTVWEWATAYLYPAGDHTVEVAVTSDLVDTNHANDTVSFTMTVPQGNVVTDLKLSNLKIKDEQNAVFTFHVKNLGPQACDPDDYVVRVSVDGLEDSYAYNTHRLGVSVHAVWDWQLAYIYPPGLHVVTIEVKPSGGDLRPADNTLDFQLMEKGTDLKIVDSSACTALVAAAFSTMLAATNGTPPYTWNHADGSLPPGLYFSGEGVLQGAPAESGSFTFNAGCTEAAGATAYANVNMVVLDSAPGEAPCVFDRVLPVAFADSYFDVQLEAAGGTPPYTWSFEGDHPFGATLSSSGKLTGTITEPDMYHLHVTVLDNIGFSTKAHVTLQVLPDTQFLNCRTAKVKIVIPWRRHDIGDDNSDTLRFNSTCSVPDKFVLDSYTRLVFYLGDYPINFSEPVKARYHKRAVFRGEKGSIPRDKATVRWTSANELAVKVKLKKADLADALAAYGVKENGDTIVSIPIRIVLNGYDTGELTQLM